MTSNIPYYFDYAATTPVDKRVLDFMLPFFRDVFGNSSSIHRYGQQAEGVIENARATMAQWLNCRSDEVIFTSGGTESDNLALRGAAFAKQKESGTNHILVPRTEHPAVLRTAQQLAQNDAFELEYLPVNAYGLTTVDIVAEKLRPSTALISIMYANNEIGTINSIAEIGSLCRSKGILFHTDAVQAAAYLPVDTQKLNVDFLSLGAHKFYGPKGIGALYVRKGVPFIPQQTGGSQEMGRRAGTSNTPYIAGLAKAFELAQSERNLRTEHVLPLRDRLIGRILEEIPQSQLTGHPQLRLPNHASFVFEGIDGNDLLMHLDLAGFACSSGSACKTGSPEPSEVLIEIGFDRDWALGSLRLTIGNESNAEQIENLLEQLPNIIKGLRK